MTEQLQSQLAQILAQIMVSVSEFKDFSVKELPEIAQQYVNYGIWSNLFYCIISATVIILCLFLGRRLLKWVVRNDYEPVFILIFPLFFLMASSTIFFVRLDNLILILTAPKVWFIMEIKNLLS